jgi:two-component system response regulator PhoP
MKVLIVEDESRLAENIATSLRQKCGFAVDLAADGVEGLFLATDASYDLVILDLMLPKLTGAEVLTRLRSAGSTVPVLILTARDEKQSVIQHLNLGADDYLGKPFDLGELIARAKGLIRRSQGHATPTIVIADLELDTVRGTVTRAGSPVALTPMEYRVLEYLAHHKGIVVSKTELLEHLYDFNWEKFSNVIEVFIAGLRRKVDGSPRLIHTVRGRGYVLQEEPWI